MWGEHVLDHPEDAKRKGPTLMFPNKTINELFNAESAKVKAEVKKRREEGFSDEELEFKEDSEDITLYHTFPRTPQDSSRSPLTNEEIP